jgi:predicted metal-dependent RNase
MNYEDFFRPPSIVLASSGMLLPGTVSFNLAKYWLKKPNSAIFTVGYMEENTPGYIVSNSSNGEKIKLTNTSENEIVKCRIKKFRFSSHAVREQLMDVVKKLNPSEVVIVHGDPPSVDWVGGTILREYEHMKVYAAEPGKELAL